MGIIYKVISPSGKVYVGQTRQRFEKRIRRHKYKNSGCTAVRNAIQKYGDKMVWDIIEEVPNELLDEREIFWIKELNCMSPNGYNLVSGGGVNRKVSQFTKDKMSLSTLRYNFEKNGYVGGIDNTPHGFCPRITVDGSKNVRLSDGPCKTKDEAIEILNEYVRDPEHFVKREGSAKYKAKGVSFHKASKKWRVYGNGADSKYLGVYETKDEAEKIYEEYLKDPEHFVRPGNRKRVGCVSFHNGRKKWQALAKGSKYIGIYKTKEEAESALDKYNTSLTP